MNQIIKNKFKILAVIIILAFVFIMPTIFDNPKARAWSDAYVTSYTYQQPYQYTDYVWHQCNWIYFSPAYKCIINPEGQWCIPGGAFGYRDCSDNATCWGDSSTAYAAIYYNDCYNYGWCSNAGGSPVDYSHWDPVTRTGYDTITAYTCYYISSVAAWSECSQSGVRVATAVNWSSRSGTSCSNVALSQSCVPPPPPTCSNGASDYPTCTTCPSGKTMVSGTCVNNCTNGASNPPACDNAVCPIPWGGTIASGSSVTAYLTPSVVSPATCTPETRNCTNGSLSGSYINQNCIVNPAPINGSCSATHYACSAGTSINNLDSPSRFTWTCAGLNGGTNSPQCVEKKSPGFGE